MLNYQRVFHLSTMEGPERCLRSPCQRSGTSPAPVLGADCSSHQGEEASRSSAAITRGQETPLGRAMLKGERCIILVYLILFEDGVPQMWPFKRTWWSPTGFWGSIFSDKPSFVCIILTLFLFNVRAHVPIYSNAQEDRKVINLDIWTKYHL